MVTADVWIISFIFFCDFFLLAPEVAVICLFSFHSVAAVQQLHCLLIGLPRSVDIADDDGCPLLSFEMLLGRDVLRGRDALPLGRLTLTGLLASGQGMQRDTLDLV